jgi:hypothetical protein
MVIRRGERRERKLKLFAIEMQSRGSGAISSRFVGDKAAEEPRTMSRLRAEPGPEHAGLSLEPSIRSPARRRRQRHRSRRKPRLEQTEETQTR